MIWQPPSTNGGRTGKAATPRACSATTAHPFATAHKICQTFGASKQKVNADKSWIKVGLNKVSLMLYPETLPISRWSALCRITKAAHLSDRTTKRQFWSRENGRWKIIHETSL